MSRAEPVRWIRDPAAIACLASPMRQSLLDRLEARGPSTVRELADSLGVAADSLYYHLRALEEVELVRSGPVDGEGSEAVYELPRRRWHIRYEPGDPANTRAVRKVTAGILRQAARDFDDGFTHEQARPTGARRNLWSLRLEARLGPRQQEALNEHLAAIVDILRAPPEDEASGTLCALSWVLAPIHEHRGRAGRRPAPGASRPGPSRRKDP